MRILSPDPEDDIHPPRQGMLLPWSPGLHHAARWLMTRSHWLEAGRVAAVLPEAASFPRLVAGRRRDTPLPSLGWHDDGGSDGADSLERCVWQSRCSVHGVLSTSQDGLGRVSHLGRSLVASLSAPPLPRERTHERPKLRAAKCPLVFEVLSVRPDGNAKRPKLILERSAEWPGSVSLRRHL